MINKIYIFLFSIALTVPAFAQVQINKTLQMTGASPSERIIDQVSDFKLDGRLYMDGKAFLDNRDGNCIFLGYTENKANKGISNIFMGYQAGKENSGANENMYIGYQAGANGTSHDFNHFIGYQTGYNNQAEYNYFVGYQSGTTNVSGTPNHFEGYQSGYSNKDGSINYFSGYQSGYTNNADNNYFSGMYAGYSNVTGTKNCFSGNYSGYTNVKGNNNTFIGYQSGYKTETGSDNVAVGFNAGLNNNAGNQNIFVGAEADAKGDFTNAVAIGYQAVVDDNNKIRLGNGKIAVIEGEVSYTFTSDSTKKENFKLVNGEEVLSKISNFRLTSWNYKGHDAKKYRHYGPMAQDFYNAFGNDGIGIFGSPITINSGDLAGVSFIAIQALEKRTTELQKELDLRNREAELKNKELDLLKADNQELHNQLNEIKSLLQNKITIIK